MTAVTRNTTRPYWMRSIDGAAYPALDRSISADVAIVGAGLTGLWTAHYLLERDPGLDIVVLEAEQVGFGASGRNGGWVSNLLPGHTAKLARKYGVEAVRAYRDAMRESVDETIGAAERLGIDADIVKSGTLGVALTPAQAARQRRKAEASRQNHPEDQLELLSAAEVRERIAVSGVHSAIRNPHVARVHPGKLVSGLAASLVRRGVSVYEKTRVTSVSPHLATVEAGTVRAGFVVRATEGFTPQFPGAGNEFLAMNSSMILTTPQSEEFWDQVGWNGQELLSDAAHDYVYGQRTADGRIALGGRGVPYTFNNGFDLASPTPASTLATLQRALTRMFPSIDLRRLEDSWSGTLAVARDWNARVAFDAVSGLASAGGYVGHGVAATNLAGRTLADLITGQPHPRTRLPWVNHRSRSWEPEPLRWLGARGVYAAYRMADAQEGRAVSEKTSPIAAVADLVSGRP